MTPSDVRAGLLRVLLATALALATSRVSAAQTVNDLRPLWNDHAMDERWRAVCGDVRNLGHVPARSVAIRVRGLDNTGQAVSTRDHSLNVGMPAGGRAVFCLPMPAGAASYNVTIVGADWGFVVEAP